MSEAGGRRNAESPRYLPVLLGRALSAGFQAVSLLLVARGVGAAEFGLFGALLALTAPVIYLSDFGSQSFAIRQRARTETAELAREVMYLQRALSAGAGMIASAALTVTWVIDWLPMWTMLIPLMFVIEKELTGALGFALSDGRSALQLYVLVVYRGVSLTCLVVSAVIGDAALIPSYLLASILVGILSVLLVYRVNPNYIRPRTADIGVFIRRGIPFWVAALSHQIRSLDVALVAFFGSTLQAGLYALPARLSGPMRIAASSLSAVALPVASRGDARELGRLNRVMLVVVAISTVALVGVMVFSELLLVQFVGAEYGGAVWPLRLLCLGLILNVPGSYMSGLLQGAGHQRYVAFMGAWLAAVAILLVPTGTWFWGATGAAAGMMTVNVVQFIVVSAGVWRWRVHGQENG